MAINYLDYISIDSLLTITGYLWINEIFFSLISLNKTISSKIKSLENYICYDKFRYLIRSMNRLDCIDPQQASIEFDEKKNWRMILQSITFWPTNDFAEGLSHDIKSIELPDKSRKGFTYQGKTHDSFLKKV